MKSSYFDPLRIHFLVEKTSKFCIKNSIILFSNSFVHQNFLWNVTQKFVCLFVARYPQGNLLLQRLRQTEISCSMHVAATSRALSHPHMPVQS